MCTGCSEMLMANVVQNLAAQTPGKEAIAIETFAKALQQVSLCGVCSSMIIYNDHYIHIH